MNAASHRSDRGGRRGPGGGQAGLVSPGCPTENASSTWCPPAEAVRPPDVTSHWRTASILELLSASHPGAAPDAPTLEDGPTAGRRGRFGSDGVSMFLVSEHRRLRSRSPRTC